jgi:D-xylonolactonase
MQVAPLFNSSAEHGEGPVWDPISQKLYWVDLLQGIYFKGDLSSSTMEEFSIGQPLGFLALRANQEGLVMGVRDGFGFYNEKSQLFNLIEPSPEQHNSEVRFNDGAVDPEGRVFGGTMEWNGADNKGKLFRLNTDHSWNVLEENIHITNGMGWNPEKDTFFMIDTNRNAVFAYDYEIESGNISNKRTHIKFANAEFPDGMTIDSEGGFWIALWGGSKLVHFDKKGNKIEEILMPVSHPTSCCFGGADLKTLIITTSKVALSEKERLENPLAGRLFKIETNTVGQIQSRYHG